MKPRDIADLLGPALVREISGFLVRRGLKRFTGADVVNLNYYLQRAVMDGLTKPHEPRVVDVVGKVVKTPRKASRS